MRSTVPRRVPVLIRILLLLLLAAAAVTGCSRGGAAPPTRVDPATADWAAIEAAARGSTVHFYMWGGSDTINRWVDGYVAEQMTARHGVTVRRVPMDAADFVNKLLTERQAGLERGSIDLVWINGENFKAARDGDLLWGPFAGRLPNFQRYVDAASPDITHDFGYPVQGYSAPWGKAQFVMVYDAAKVPEPPRSFPALREWVQEHPGRFTYPAPPDFTGSAFIRMALYETTGGHAQYLGGYDEALLTGRWQATWDLLRAMALHLWQGGETYPESLSKLNQLYADGEVWFSMNYDPSAADNLVRRGIWPATTRTYLFDAGTIGNTHFVAVPFNAPNIPGALALANFLLSPEAQLSKQDPAQWGDFVAIDPDRLDPADRERLAAIERGPATLAPDELAARRVPEIAPGYVLRLEDGWREHIARARP